MSIQIDRAFSLGNAMSLAPIMIGRTKFARPANAGMTKRKIISVAWTLKRPLYVSPSPIAWPGSASSARTSSAKIPPITKNVKTVTRYWTPMTLWSVLTLK